MISGSMAAWKVTGTSFCGTQADRGIGPPGSVFARPARGRTTPSPDRARRRRDRGVHLAPSLGMPKFRPQNRSTLDSAAKRASEVGTAAAPSGSMVTIPGPARLMSGPSRPRRGHPSGNHSPAGGEHGNGSLLSRSGGQKSGSVEEAGRSGRCRGEPAVAGRLVRRPATGGA